MVTDSEKPCAMATKSGKTMYMGETAHKRTENLRKLGRAGNNLGEIIWESQIKTLENLGEPKGNWVKRKDTGGRGREGGEGRREEGTTKNQ
eukprot:6180318-Pleurochrysis_carterae.AAC.1